MIKTADQRFEVNPKNFKANNGYNFAYTVTDLLSEEIILEEPITQTNDEYFTIEADTLNFGGRYRLTVTVISISEQQQAETTKSVDFITGSEPQVDQFTVTPREGEMYNELFKVVLTGYEG